MERFFHLFWSLFEALCLLVVWSESHIFQFMHRQKTPFFTFLKQSFILIRYRVFNTFWINASNTRMSMFWDLYNFCIDILTFAVEVDSTKYWWRNVRHPISITCDAFLATIDIQVAQIVTILRSKQKVKKMIFCLCIVWKKWDFDQSTTEQRASKKVKNTIFDFTLLRSVSEFDRGQPRNVVSAWPNSSGLFVKA